SYQATPTRAALLIQFEADFADIFEVRGTHRAARGRDLGAAVQDGGVVLGYEGLDRVVRRTHLRFDPAPTELRQHEAVFEISLPPQGEAAIDVVVSCESPEAVPHPLGFEEARARLAKSLTRLRAHACSLHGSHERFNDWVARARADLDMMTTRTDRGLYPYAGVPWFSTPFGRDGIITALECLAFEPELARGVLGFLAATQATESAPEQDAQPGKILHEARGGE